MLYIVGGLPLSFLLASAWTIAVISYFATRATTGPRQRARLLRAVGVGLVIGLFATIAYDVTKAILAQLDPSPYNPFEVTRIFGQILIGTTAPDAAITIVGWSFHLLNGCTFGVAFACLFARSGRISRLRGWAYGLAWGLFLETMQLALYPGWLNTGFVDEFRRISFLSHIVFGTILGFFVPAGLRWVDRRRAASAGGFA